MGKVRLVDKAQAEIAPPENERPNLCSPPTLPSTFFRFRLSSHLLPKTRHSRAKNPLFCPWAPSKAALVRFWHRLCCTKKADNQAEDVRPGRLRSFGVSSVPRNRAASFGRVTEPSVRREFPGSPVRDRFPIACGPESRASDCPIPTGARPWRGDRSRNVPPPRRGSPTHRWPHAHGPV